MKSPLIFLLSLLSFLSYSQEIDSTILESLSYRNLGPTRGGRVTAVAGIASSPSHYYMGATGGGLWKTKDFGMTWNNVSDGYFATPSIGAVRVCQTNPNIVYVGTGTDGLRSNIITGKGIYKSENGGKSWNHIGLKETGHIGAVEIHPDNPDIVFVAAIGNAFIPNSERGVFRSLNGGQDWEKVLYIADTIGIADVEFHPTNPDIIYAAAWRAERKPWTIISGGMEGGIYKSTNGGDDWQKLKEGLPQGLIGKIDLAVSADDPDRLYALIEAPKGIGGLYQSKTQGDTFNLISTKKELLDRPFYYCNVDADPQNADVVYVNSTRFFKSKNGGKSWTRLRTPHGDNHDMWINPKDSMNFIQGNDGGANVTVNGGQSWSTQLNQSTAELYQVEVDDQTPYWLYAGQQDNSTTISVPSAPPFGVQAGGLAFVRNTGGCETGPAVPKPGNPDIVYSNCKGRFGVFDKKTGQEKRYYVGASNMYGHNPKELQYRFQRVSPIHVSPHDPDVIYHCSQFVHKSTNDGKTWTTISPDLTAFTPETQTISGSPITRDITGEEFYSTIYSIQESKIKKGQIWVGANDGPVHLTQDGGLNWKDVTPKMKSGGRVDCVEPSSHNPGKAFCTVLRYQLGDWTPYIFRTLDYGTSWTLVNKGIPNDFPVRVIREDPDREGLLYAGTEFGMFVSLNDGDDWQSFQQNLPITPITDIKVHQKDLVLSTMGRGFWILDNLSPLHGNTLSDLSNKRPTLFPIPNAHKMRYRGTSKKSIPYYPSAAADIDYYLPKTIKNQIRLDILNNQDQIVRSYFSPINEDKTEEEKPKERNMATGFIQQGINAKLKTSQGFHRFTWDMRHAGPWDKDDKKAFGNGPFVSPGRYTVRLTVDGNSYEEPIEVLENSLVKTGGVTIEDLKKQENLSLEMVSLINRAKRLLAKVDNQMDQHNDKPVSQEKLDKLQRIKSKLKTEEGRYMKPKLIAQINYLYSMIRQADQEPGEDAYLRFEDLKQQFSLIEKRAGD